MKPRALAVLAMIGLTFGLIAPGTALAQSYPIKSIRIIVPYPAGGSTDQLARLMTPRLSASLGQTVYIENIGGGATMIGTGAAARSAPDGYTLLVTSLAFSVNVLLSKSPSYKMEDFVPVAPVIAAPYIMTVHPSVPAHTVRELIDYAKREPAKVNAASLGPGGVTHLLNERFATLAGVPITSIHYRGAGPAQTDVLAGRVQFFIDNLVTAIPHVRSGKVRPLGITTAERSNLIPDVPTFKELGFPGMTQDSWFGVFAPTGTPKPIVDRLNREVLDAVRSKEFQVVAVRDGLKVVPYSPEQFADFIKQDAAVWERTLKSLNIQLQ